MTDSDRLREIGEQLAQLEPDARRIAAEVTDLALALAPLYAELGQIGGSLVEDAVPGTESATWDALYDVAGWNAVQPFLAVIAGAIERCADTSGAERYYEESALAAELVVVPAAP